MTDRNIDVTDAQDSQLKALFAQAAANDAGQGDAAFVQRVMIAVNRDVSRQRAWREAAMGTALIIAVALVGYLAPQSTTALQAALTTTASHYGLTLQGMTLGLVFTAGLGGWWLATRQ